VQLQTSGTGRSGIQTYTFTYNGSPSVTTATVGLTDVLDLKPPEANLTLLSAGSTFVATNGTFTSRGACFAARTPFRTSIVAVVLIEPGDLVPSRSELDPSGAIEAKIVEELFATVAPVWTCACVAVQLLPQVDTRFSQRLEAGPLQKNWSQASTF
jgi:hypothetical protein